MTQLLEWRNTTRYVNERKRPLSAIRDRFFRREETAASENIETVIKRNHSAVAPFTKLGAPAIMVMGETDEKVTFKPTNIRIKRPIDQDIMSGSVLGNSVFVSPQEMARQIRYKRERELAAMPDMVDNAIEWLCCKALSGSISYNVNTFAGVAIGANQTFDQFTYTYGHNGSKVTLTGTAKWSAATTATPSADFRLMQRTVNQAVRLPITDAIFGQNAMDAFLACDEVKEYMDKRRLLAGQIDLTNGFNEDGVSFIGSYCGVRCWEYNHTVTLWSLADNNTAGARVTDSLFNTNEVVFLCGLPRAEMALHYGVVRDLPQMQGRNLQTRYFSKRWVEQDPPVEHHLVASRPVPIPHRPGAIIVLDPLTGS